MNIKEHAEKEMKRMQEVMGCVKLISKSKEAKEFLDFATNYYNDGFYFFKKKQYVESFETFIIAWAYLDISLKLKFLDVPKNLKKNFTIEN